MKISTLFVMAIVLSPAAREWKVLESAEYRIQYPDDWSLDQGGLSGTKFILFSPDTEGRGFRNNVNLIIQDLAGMNISLKKYVEISESQVKQFITSAEILVSTTKDDRHEIVYKGTQGEYFLKWKQYYWVKNEKAFVLTLTTTENSFDAAAGTANQIMNSFEIK